MKILFITNFCPHYHKKPFEELSNRYDTEFIFYATGEHYHKGKNTVNNPHIKYKYILSSIRRPISIYKIIKHGNFDIVIKCAGGGYLTIYSFLLSKLYGSKFIFWSNIWYYGNNIRSLVTRTIHKYLYQHSDAIVTYGTHIDKYIIDNIPAINCKKIFHSFNVVDNLLFNKRILDSEIEYLKNILAIKYKKILLYVGRNSEEKGLGYLFKAHQDIVQKYNNVALIIIGEGNFIIDDSKTIINLGHIENSQLYKYYSLADIFILPSITAKKWKEPWGLVINEAMNCGNAIIATEAVGAAVGGLLKNGITGYIVPERDSAALKEAIEKLLLNEELLNTIKVNNKEIIKLFDEKLLAQGFQEAINFII